MTKELLTVEFRYHDKPISEYDVDRRTKTITVGIFDTLEEAISEGNRILDVLSESFEVRSDDRFQLHYLLGFPKRLVTNTCYPTKGIEYFAKIEKLRFDNLSEVINEVFDAYKKYKEE